MLRSLSLSACCLIFLVMAASGCKLYRTSDSPDQASENERLRAENARLQADLANNNKGQPAPKAQQPVPPSAPSISPEASKRLREHGVIVTKEGDRIKMTLPNTILFSAGSASLRSDSKKALDQAAKAIKTEFPSSDLRVQGHTDNQPILHSANKFKTNMELSVARAQAVAAALQKQGLKNKIKVEGLGESMPLNGNKTSEEQAKNRRVEILITAPGTGKDKTPVAAPADEAADGGY
jgi:chemotaxis protein MotB